MNRIKAVLYTDEELVTKTYPELEKLFAEALKEGKVNHYEVVSGGKKDKKA